MEKTNKKYDFMTIGSATLDVFIESDQSIIASYAAKEAGLEFMCFPYGSKIEIDDFSRNIGGGGINTALNFANLGFKTTTAVKMGEADEIREVIEERLKEGGVDLENIVRSEHHMTGFSVILVSFQGDRTVLAHRGANAHMESKDLNLKALKDTKWLYVAPLSGKSGRVLDDIANFARKNHINLAINAGTTSIKRGKKYFEQILKAAQILVLNKEEAQMLTEIDVRPDSKNDKFSKEKIHPDMCKIFKELRHKSSALIVVTDGKNGAWAYDGKAYYHCPEFPAHVVSTLGAGDAFASTLTATIEKYGDDLERALKYASVNAASVVEYYGAQEGFIGFDEIEKRLAANPDFHAETIECD